MTIQDYILGFATLITILSAIREIRKGPSESEQRVTASALGMMDKTILRLDAVEKEVKHLQAEIDKLEIEKDKLKTDVHALENENIKLKAGINILISQLEESGISPQWTPQLNYFSQS